MTRSGWILGALLCSAVSVFSATRAIAGSSLAPGLYDNAQGSPVVDLIEHATKTLHMEIYEMDDPKVIAAIRSALRRGVIVHIVKEPNPAGAACKVFEEEKSRGQTPPQQSLAGADCEEQRGLIQEVENAHGRYEPFEKSAFCGDKNCLEHGKLVIADSEWTLISSGNFNTTNLCDLEYSPRTCNRDYSFVSHDADVADTLTEIVERDLTGKDYDVGSIVTGSIEQKITVGPDSLEPIVDFIKTAKKSIQVENQYLKDPTLNEALIEAANRGVDIEVTIASACSFGEPKAGEKKKLTDIFESFDEAGIKTRAFNKNIRINGKPGYLHAKAIVIDGARAWVGSVNGSTQATTQNREFGIFFDDSTEVKELSQIMKSDFEDPNEETWQESLDCSENGRLAASLL